MRLQIGAASLSFRLPRPMMLQPRMFTSGSLSVWRSVGMTEGSPASPRPLTASRRVVRSVEVDQLQQDRDGRWNP